MVKPRELLILKYDDFRNEVSHFFAELKKDNSVRELFFQNPSLVLRTKLPSLNSINVLDQQDDVANRILFSVLSNERFKVFLKEYQTKMNVTLERLLKTPNDKQASNALDERTIRLEFADAMLEFGDRELLLNIFSNRGSFERGGPMGWWLIVVAVLIVVVAAAVHAVLALGTSGDFAPTARGRLPISAAELRKIADQLVAAAAKARQAGQLA